MNNSIIKADIFFTITTVAVVVGIVCLIVISIYIIRILRDFKILSKKAKDEGEQILDDIRIVREDAEKKGTQTRDFFSTIFSSIKSSIEPKKKRGAKNQKEV